jgi:hypothetical protein
MVRNETGTRCQGKRIYGDELILRHKLDVALLCVKRNNMQGEQKVATKDYRREFAPIAVMAQFAIVAVVVL